MASSAMSPPLSRRDSFDLLDPDPQRSLQSISDLPQPTESSPLLGRTPEQSHSTLPQPVTSSSTSDFKQRRPSENFDGNQTRWTHLRQRSKYYVPLLDWLPNYQASQFWGDFAAGVSVASVLIPQSMSYATSLAHLDASVGLFASAIPGIVYALFGTCRQLNTGPEAALSLLVGQTISSLVEGDPHAPEGKAGAVAVSTILTFQVGLISFMLGFVRLGFLDVVLSKALLRGFITAVAVVIMVEQLIPMVGLEQFIHTVDPPPHSVLEKIGFLFEYTFSHGKSLTALVSFASLAGLVITRITKKRIAAFGGKWKAAIYLPEVFLCVVITTALSDIYDWHKKGLATLGRMTVGFDDLFELPVNRDTLSYMQTTTSTALLMCIAGFLDSIAAAKQNSSRFGYSISPNRELVALGAGNLAASFVPGTIPAFGSITRSRMNADAGGRTQMASLVCSSLVILSVFLILPALRYLPKCVLAAVIGIVVYTILAEAPHDIHYFWSMSAWTDLALMLLTFTCTVLWNVEVGIIVSVSVSLVLIVRRSSQPHIRILGRVPGTDRWKPVNHGDDDDETALSEDGMVGQEEVPGVLIVRVRDDLDFANTGHLKERLRRLEVYGPKRTHPSAPSRRRQSMRAVVFHMADVEKIDASALQIIAEVCATYRTRDVEVHFAHLRTGQMELFKRAHIVPDSVPMTRVHPNVASAMGSIESSSQFR